MVVLTVPPLPSRRCASWRAVCVTSAYLMSAHAPRAAATLLVIAKATSRMRTSARKCGCPCCCCGCGLLRSPDAGVAREVARGSRDARAATSVRARSGAAPRAALNWGLVLQLLPAWPGASAVVFLAFLTRPTGGIAGEWPSKSPNGHPSHHTTSPGTEVRPRGHPPATQPPQGDLGPKFSQLRPNTAPSEHHHFAPPSRAARSRRPLAPSTRAARSRCPLAPPARAVRSRRNQPLPAPDPHHGPSRPRPPNTAPSAHHHFSPPPPSSPKAPSHAGVCRLMALEMARRALCNAKLRLCTSLLRCSVLPR